MDNGFKKSGERPFGVHINILEWTTIFCFLKDIL